MHHRLFTPCLLLLFGLVAPSLSRAQVTTMDDTTAIMRAAAVRARSGYGAGATKVDVAGSPSVRATRVAEVAKALSAEPATLEATRVCSGRTPNTCRLVGARLFLQVLTPVVKGDAAEVTVRVSEQTDNTRQPVHSTEMLVILARHDESWVATDTRIKSES